MHWPLGHECCWWLKLDSSLLFTSASTYLHPVICVGHWGFTWRNMDSYSDPNCVQKLKGPLGTRVSHQPFCRAQLCHSAATPCQLQAYSSKYHLDTTTSYRSWTGSWCFTEHQNLPPLLLLLCQALWWILWWHLHAKLIFSPKGENASLPFRF